MTDPNAPAYPVDDYLEDGRVYRSQEQGLTVREVFVKDIYCALIANSNLTTVLGYLDTSIQRQRAFVEADALLAELARTEG